MVTRQLQMAYLFTIQVMDVNVGDQVRVRGNVSEYHNLTEIICFIKSGNALQVTLSRTN